MHAVVIGLSHCIDANSCSCSCISSCGCSCSYGVVAPAFVVENVHTAIGVQLQLKLQLKF